LRNSIEGYCHVPVIGAIPKLRQHQFPERHMGLVPTAEHDWAADAVNSAAEIIGKHIDLDHLIQIARQAPSDAWPDAQILPLPSPVKDAPVIGVIRDSAFQFYYAENLEALQRAGAQLEFFSALTCSDLPRIDALYIGGGFPETHARQLADNVTLRKQIRQAAHQGLPVYAECGGLMYLGEALELEGKHYPMVGIFPAVFGISRRPRGHGYTVVDVSGANPFFPVGVQIKGHEFHYSSVVNWRGVDTDLVFDMNRGEGFFNRKDGLRFKNVLATYTHIHAQGTPVWAPAMVRLAGDYRQAAAAK
jgi:cobyrinic acid a,c-diamide synthase